jgi:5-methylcytosine-specific restriction endonuclease McrA
MSKARKQHLLDLVYTDKTFQPEWVRGEIVWLGRCIHCDRKLMIALDGTSLGPVSIEHIIPLNHGGENSLKNTAIACTRCNNAKGYRLDHLPLHNERLQRVITLLQERRQNRWRTRENAPNPTVKRP